MKRGKIKNIFRELRRNKLKTNNEKDCNKKIYFAGSMIIDPKTQELDLEKDYRTFLVDSKKILMPFDPIKLNNKYSYGWPSFYYADEHGKPSLSSKLIADMEFKIIPEIDILVAFLQEKITAGTIGEIMYAAMNKKLMYIYYIPSPTESEVYATNQWYPILMAERINPGNVRVSEVKNLMDLLNHLKDDFGIQAIRYPKNNDKSLT